MSHKPSSASFSSGNYESTNGYGGTKRSKEADLFVSNKETESYNRNEIDRHPKEKVTQKSQRSALKDDSDDDFDPRAETATYGKYLSLRSVLALCDANGNVMQVVSLTDSGKYLSRTPRNQKGR